MIRVMILLLILVVCTGCTNFAMLMSGGGVALSHNAYLKAYNGIDFLTIINTEKDIKTHLYQSIHKENK
jgi:hypothetical protein